MPGRYPLDGFHQDHLVVTGHVRHFEQRGNLVLPRRHFVVPGLHRHAHPVELPLDIGHEPKHPLRDGAEVVVFHLLALGRLGAEERALARHHVGPGKVEFPVHQEILLLRAQRGDDRLDVPVGTEEAEDPHGLLRQRFGRTVERDLGVERFAGPAHEGGGNAERGRRLAPHQECGAGRVPGGVTPRLECGSQSPAGKTRRVRLALHQLAAREVENHAAAPVRRHQRVMLLGGESGQRLEPVGVVGRPILDGPVLHRCCHDARHLGIERLPVFDGLHQALVDLSWEPLPHNAGAEDVGTKESVDPGGVVVGGRDGHLSEK